MSQTDWFPDWLLPDSAHRAPSRTSTTNPPSLFLQSQSPTSAFDSYRLSDVSNGASTSGSRIETAEQAEAAEKIPQTQDGDELLIERNRDRAVKYVSRTVLSRARY